MTTVPKAHELADALEALAPHVVADALKFEAATELRRLHAANVDCLEHFNALKAERDELLAIAKGSRHLVQEKLNSGYDTEYWQQILSEIDAAIAKAEA